MTAWFFDGKIAQELKTVTSTRLPSLKEVRRTPILATILVGVIQHQPYVNEGTLSPSRHGSYGQLNCQKHETERF